MDVAEAIGIIILVILLAIFLGMFTGWLWMLTIGSILGNYGLAGPSFFQCWAFSTMLGLTAGGSSASSKATD